MLPVMGQRCNSAFRRKRGQPIRALINRKNFVLTPTRLRALQAIVGMAAMVPDDEDAHTIAHNSKQEVIGEAFEVGPPEVGFDEVVSARTLGSLDHETAQFAIEGMGQFRVHGPS